MSKWVLFLLCASTWAQVRVAGTVVDASGNPIEGAVVNFGFMANSRIRTNADGAFAFPSAAPGGYTFRVERPGFAPLRDASYIEVTGQPVTGIRLVLTREGVISGTITDPMGQPAVGVVVNALERSFEYGSWDLTPRGNATTDQNGSYRIGGLAPGRYFVRVGNPGGASFGRGSFGMSIGPPQLQTVEAYYPRGVDEAEAQSIAVTEGSQHTGIDIRMREGLRYTIRGQLVNEAGDPLPGVSMAIRDERSPVVSDPRSAMLPARTTRRQDGGFEFRNLSPGRYWIVSPAGNPVHWERVAVTVTDDDVEGMIVRATAGGSLKVTARVEMEGGAQPPYGLNLTLIEDPAPTGYHVLSTRLGEPLVFYGLAPGTYRVRMDNLHTGMYVKAIYLGDRDVTHELFEIRQAETDLRVVLSARAGYIQGRVRPGMRVILWPREPHPEWTALGVWSVAADQNGRFGFAGADPGAYFLAAWETAPGFADTNYDFVDRFREAALAVDLGEEQMLTIEAPVIPAAQIQEEFAKLP